MFICNLRVCKIHFTFACARTDFIQDALPDARASKGILGAVYKGRPANGERGVVLKFRAFPDGGRGGGGGGVVCV